jgi:predicted HTH transcriptional regulator
MANAFGGYLLTGVDEENGIACQVVGVDSTEPDALIRKIIESIRTSTEPPILDVRVRWVETSAGRGVLMIQKGDRSRTI